MYCKDTVKGVGSRWQASGGAWPESTRRSTSLDQNPSGRAANSGCKSGDLMRDDNESCRLVLDSSPDPARPLDSWQCSAQARWYYESMMPCLQQRVEKSVPPFARLCRCIRPCYCTYCTASCRHSSCVGPNTVVQTEPILCPRLAARQKTMRNMRVRFLRRLTAGA